MKKTESVGGTHPDNPLQKARIKAGVRQADAAEYLDCDTCTLQRYEAGETKPDMDLLRAMRECYRCEIADLFAGDTRPASTSGGEKE